MPAFSYPLPSFSTSPGDPFGSAPAAGSFSAASDALPDYPVYDAATGTYLSRKTRKPYTGSYQGQTFNMGQAQPTATQQAIQAAQQINPNDPSQRYQAVSIGKQPDVAKQEEDLMKQFTDQASKSLQDFSSYLNNFKTDVSAARTAGAAATNIAPTVQALTQAQQQYTTGLNAADTAYQRQLASNAANERGVVQQELGTLPAYDTALSNIENAQLAGLQNLVSRYKLGTGTPMSMGSDEQRLLARAAQEAALPIELQKATAQRDILQQAALPVEQQIGAQGITYTGQFLPQVAGAQYTSATGLANQVQSLKEKTANMSMQQALQYMQAAGVPPQIAQQVLAGNISTLTGLSNLESASSYQGLQDLLGVLVDQPNAPLPALPGLPNYAPRSPTTLTSTYAGAPGSPMTISPVGVPTGAPAVLSPGAGSASTGGYAYRGIPNYGTGAYQDWLTQQARLSQPTPSFLDAYNADAAYQSAFGG